MTTRHDLLFELFAVLRCGHDTDFTSHARLNLFFVTVHETCSTPLPDDKERKNGARLYIAMTLLYNA